jgi:hypothetical protein
VCSTALVIPHNHKLDGHFHKECPSCSYTLLKLQRTNAHKKADKELEAVHKKNIERYARARGRKRK